MPTYIYIKNIVHKLMYIVKLSLHKIFEKIGYYLIKLGTKKVLIHFEYIEKLEKKKRILKNSFKKNLNSLEKLYFKFPMRFVFYD